MAQRATLKITLGQDDLYGWRLIVSQSSGDDKRSTIYFDRLERCDELEEVRAELTEMLQQLLAHI